MCGDRKVSNVGAQMLKLIGVHFHKPFMRKKAEQQSLDYHSNKNI